MNFDDKAAAVEELSLSAQPGDGTLRSTDVAHVSLKRLDPEAPSGHPSERRLLLKVNTVWKEESAQGVPRGSRSAVRSSDLLAGVLNY
jgi:hypothetical protein